MVEQLRRYGIRDSAVLAAMLKIRRHVFVPASDGTAGGAYGDHPSSIGHRQTISQPYIVAYMTERLQLKRGETVLDVGTGSGYQAAVLAELGMIVHGIERIPALAAHARSVLAAEGYGAAVDVVTGDGYEGCPAHAPFDAILVACAPVELPATLPEQLAEGGRMIVPVGAGGQRLVLLRRKGGRVERTDEIAVRFVPMLAGVDMCRPTDA